MAFSNGSLLAGFIDRIMKHQPLVAPKDVKRYFVSPEESGQICMLACSTGETTADFFPEVTGGTDDDVLVNMRQVSRRLSGTRSMNVPLMKRLGRSLTRYLREACLIPWCISIATPPGRKTSRNFMSRVNGSTWNDSGL